MVRIAYYLYFFLLVVALVGVLYFSLFHAFAFLHVKATNRHPALMCLNSLERNVTHLSRLWSCLSVLLSQHDGSKKGGPLDYTSGILNINVIDILNINKKITVTKITLELCKLVRFVISAGYNFPSLEAEVSDFKHGLWN